MGAELVYRLAKCENVSKIVVYDNLTRDNYNLFISNSNKIGNNKVKFEMGDILDSRKIRKLLKCYEPDLVQLHGGVEKQPHRAEYIFSANLSLPTGTLHANGEGPDAATSARKAFVELETQIKKHQSRLRKDYEWKRKRGRPEQALA